MKQLRLTAMLWWEVGGGRKTYVLSKQERPCLTSLHVRNSFYHSKERIILRFWEERMCDFLIKKMKYKLGTQLMWRLHNVLRNKMRGFNEKQLSKRCQSWMLLLGPMSNHEDVKQDWKLHLIVKVRMFLSPWYLRNKPQVFSKEAGCQSRGQKLAGFNSLSFFVMLKSNPSAGPQSFLVIMRRINEIWTRSKTNCDVSYFFPSTAVPLI